MIRVLHAGDPGEAGRRLDFQGVSRADRTRLVRDLRSYLFCIPEGEAAPALPALLARWKIPSAWGKGMLFFSVSSVDQLDEWMSEGEEARIALAQAGKAIRRYLAKDFIVPCRGRELRLGGSPSIMGILNVTPDSFSDGGKYRSAEAAVRRGREMTEEGAGIIDVGGESTRPGSLPVPAGEEIARVAPVIRELARETAALLSVDTTKAVVARAAIDAGAHMVNDTSALADDPEMAGVVGESGCAVVLMHRRGTPATMQRSPHYDSLFDEMLDELRERIAAAEGAGIPGERILVDPGVGFGKRFEDNLTLHRHLPDLRNLGRPVVFGPSRKAFIGRITGKEAPGRIFGTAASIAFAASLGAHVLRVHDVKEMKEVLQVVSAIREGAEC
ncbi:MAG TPA: dihydropteroate synthase [Candidatus Limnocylindrales bacterium]|nr:dihydropteroate synthase [Candidatus Limnocylindrales bacterium]